MKLCSFKEFQKIIYGYYEEHGRLFPWRETRDPYQILISEVMLQQTQTDRVLKKYNEFLRAFPDSASLARAPLRQVLAVWQGLGYNRRALMLKHAAEKIAADYNSKIPRSVDALMLYPGIGRATASAIVAFAFNQPTVFIETNIRSVFIHFFFSRRRQVDDSEILPLIEKTLDRKNPRTWYYALMDYGAMLKKKYPNPSRKSKHHHRQSPFEGSRRQARGKLVQFLITASANASPEEIAEKTAIPMRSIEGLLREFEQEGFIKRKRGKIMIA